MAINKRLIKSNDEAAPTSPYSFNTVLYTGNGSTQPITDVGFQPDLVWIKERGGTGNHSLFDSVRGVERYLLSNSTIEEIYCTNYPNYCGKGVNSFDTDGFTVTDSTSLDFSVNYPSRTYVAWCWKAGGAAVTNTDGTITSQVSANVDAGFSVVSWTGLGDNGQTVGHGLGTPPQLIITKCRNLSGEHWYTYSEEIGNTKFLALNLTSAARTATEAGYSYGSNFWNNTSPTSSVFSLGNIAEIKSNNHVAYCFAEVAGFSKFGSYSGGGATDVTVNLGFEPAFIMIKRATGGTGNWVMYDNKRQVGTVPYDNYTILLADDAFQEQSELTIRGIQFTSTGFVANQDYVLTNLSGSSYIYMAFANQF